MRVLEVGSYIAVAYAGMILREQGHEVTKIVRPDGDDPILELQDGQRLYDFLNEGKELRVESLREVPTVLGSTHPGKNLEDAHFEIVIENVTPGAWERAEVDLDELAWAFGLRWAGLRAEVGERSFDIIAQARAWGGPYVPFYIGDTAAGLWLAFKALNTAEGRVATIGHATCLAKLREGDLVCPPPPVRHVFTDDETRYEPGRDPPGTYYASMSSGEMRSATVQYRGHEVRSEAWSDEDRARSLRHRNGRYLI